MCVCRYTVAITERAYTRAPQFTNIGAHITTVVFNLSSGIMIVTFSRVGLKIISEVFKKYSELNLLARLAHNNGKNVRSKTPVDRTVTSRH